MFLYFGQFQEPRVFVEKVLVKEKCMYIVRFRKRVSRKIVPSVSVSLLQLVVKQII